MPTRESILTLVRSGLSYRQIGRKLGLRPALAYLIATGSAADGGDEAEGPGAQSREGVLPGSAQYLADPPVFVPDTDGVIDAWRRGRAQADAALRTAAAARPVAPPALADDGDDLIDVIGHDHGRIRYLQQELQTLPKAGAGAVPDDLRRRAEALAILRTLLAGHEEAEARVFWPMVRERLLDGDTLAQDGLDQEQRLRQLSAKIGEARDGDSTSARSDDLATDLVDRLRKHLAFEDAVLARVYDTVGENERIDLGRRFKAERRAAAPARTGASS